MTSRVDDPPRDEELLALYRASALDEPSAGHDLHVLQAAARELDRKGSKSVWWQRMRLPLSLAATIVVAVSATLALRHSASPRPDTLTALRSDSGPDPGGAPEAPPPVLAANTPNPSPAATESIDRSEKAEATGAASRASNARAGTDRLAQPVNPAASPRGPVDLTQSSPPAVPRAGRPEPFQKPFGPARAAGPDEPDATAAAGVDKKLVTPGPAAQAPLAAPAPPSKSQAPEALASDSAEPRAGALAGDAEVNRSPRAKTNAAPVPAASASPSSAAVPNATNGERFAAPSNRLQALAGSPATPAQRIDAIRALRKLGRLKEADAALREFQTRYPGYPLPDDLRQVP